MQGERCTGAVLLTMPLHCAVYYKTELAIVAGQRDSPPTDFFYALD